VVTWIEAAQGRLDPEGEALVRQRELAQRLGLPYQAMAADAAVGLLLLGQERYAEASSALRRAADLKSAHAICDPTTQPFVGPDLVEALARSGEIVAARTLAVSVLEAAERSERPT